jgi:8-amino-3,8-dideoxy-alpha-D-manno-octulosonate transaminase
MGDAGTFSFDFYKTITTGEGGMVITRDESTYIRASEYADHGHDHNPAVGRALEGRSFLGFNYRMTEMQGAVGVAQMDRLPEILDTQKRNAKKIRSLLESLKSVELWSLPGNGVDSNTHVCFFLPDHEKASEFHKRLAANGVSAIYFKNNLWHFIHNWEHLLEKKTAWPDSFPFCKPFCQSEIQYSSNMLPKTQDYLARTIVLPISLKLTEAAIDNVCSQIEAASKEIL